MVPILSRSWAVLLSEVRSSVKRDILVMSLSRVSFQEIRQNKMNRPIFFR